MRYENDPPSPPAALGRNWKSPLSKGVGGRGILPHQTEKRYIRGIDGGFGITQRFFARMREPPTILIALAVDGLLNAKTITNRIITDQS